MREGKASRLPGAAAIHRGWWIVAALFTTAAVIIGSSQYAFGLFVEPLEGAFGWSRTQISASLSFSAVGSVTAVLIGRLLDRYGARPVMVASLGLTGLSFLLRPLMTELWHWYALSFLQYLGFSGTVMLPAGRLVGIWFRRTRGRVMGITMMGNNFGGLVMPPIAGFVMAVTSWQGAYLVIGVAVLLVGLFSLVVVSESAAINGAEGGPAPASSPSGAGQSQTALTGLTLKQALRTRSFYVLTAAFLMGTLPFAVLLPQMIAHLTNEGFSLTTASLLISVLAAFGMTGKLTFGLLAERISARYAMMLSFSGLAVASLLVGNPGSSTVITWLSVPLFGLCMGAFGTLFMLIIQENFGLRNFGSITGLMNMATAATFAVGPLVGGISFDMTGSYQLAFVLVAVMMAVGVVLLSQASHPGPAAAQGD